MNYLTFACLIAAGGFCFLFLLHILWCRLHPRKDSFPVLHKLFCLLLPTIFILCYFGFSTPQSAKVVFSEPAYSTFIFHAIITSSVFLFACLAFYAAVDHSVRIRLIIELYDKNGASKSSQEIFKKYDPHIATLNRMEKMLIAGYIAKTDSGNYILTKKGKQLAKYVLKGKDFFKVGIGGGLE